MSRTYTNVDLVPLCGEHDGGRIAAIWRLRRAVKEHLTWIRVSCEECTGSTLR